VTAARRASHVGGAVRLLSPLRLRLVAGFAAAMLLVLAAAGGFVFWRVELALDRTLDAALTAQAAELRRALAAHAGDPQAALAAVAPDSLSRVTSATGAVVASTPAARSLEAPPLRGGELAEATSATVVATPGHLLTGGKARVRYEAFPVALPGSSPGLRDAKGGLVAVTAVRLGQRDEALRELLAQLAAANLAALALAAVVGYRLAGAALRPVERYRSRAEQIAHGQAGVRLEVPGRPDDEVTRLGHTLNAMLATLEAAAEAQRHFIADASHELRSPLTVLSTEVELALRRPRTAEEYEQTLRAVAEDTQRLVTLADRLLDLERARQDTAAAGTAHPARHPAGGSGTADAVEAVARAARTAGRAAHAAGRGVTVSSPAALPVAAEALVLDQVLTNLVGNAVAHGEGTVTLTARRLSGVVLLQVHDDGYTPAEFLPRAVQRFSRADAARTVPGSGLGLALVHALVSGHAGELRLCGDGAHHRYPPLRCDGVTCRHPSSGTTATVLLPSPRADTT